MISTVTTGIIASLLSLTSAGPSLRAAPVGPDCWYSDYYCSNTAGVASVLLETGTYEEKIEECYNLCNAKAADLDAPCVAFTLRNVRGMAQCYLLTEACEQDNTDKCLSQTEPCTSGPADCDAYVPEDATCPQPTAFGGDYLNWNCYLGATQINPYTDIIPVDTICKQTCPSWKSEGASGGQSQLESTCVMDGMAGWSDTVTHDGEPIAGFPAPYPKPDALETGDAYADALTCSCLPLDLKWDADGELGPNPAYFYDPNVEEAADFICEAPIETTPGEWKIIAPNSCTLYCDQHYVATAECVDGEWTGNPEWGFWCYDEPVDPTIT